MMARIGWSKQWFVDNPTVGDLIDGIRTINDADEAQEFYEAYVQYIITAGGKDKEAAQDTARQNIGFVFDEGMSHDQQAMWKEVCGAYHPWFPMGLPDSPEEAFAAGQEMGKAMKTYTHDPISIPVGARDLIALLDGVRYYYDHLLIIVSEGIEPDGLLWRHASVTRQDGALPTYDDLLLLKRLAIGEDRTALQIFPPKNKHVNIHPACLHLWTCMEKNVTPDFTHGKGTI